LEDFGLKPLEIKCMDILCNHEYSVNFDDPSILVSPFRGNEKLARDRIKLRKNGDNKSNPSTSNES
jgi:hypothetical protein